MLQIAILVVSSKISTGVKEDTGRLKLEEMVRSIPGTVQAYQVVQDDQVEIRETLRLMCGQHEPDILFTVGGTGIRPTDWAPEATRDVIEKEIPGIGEAMRQESLKKVKTAMLSRGTAGIRGQTLIVNLPGSSKGAEENLITILPILEHMVEKISGKKIVL